MLDAAARTPCATARPTAHGKRGPGFRSGRVAFTAGDSRFGSFACNVRSADNRRTNSELRRCRCGMHIVACGGCRARWRSHARGSSQSAVAGLVGYRTGLWARGRARAPRLRRADAPGALRAAPAGARAGARRAGPRGGGPRPRAAPGARRARGAPRGRCRRRRRARSARAQALDVDTKRARRFPQRRRVGRFCRRVGGF